MNEPVQGAIGFTVAEYNQASKRPERISGEDLYPTVEAAEEEADDCRAFAAKYGRRETYRVCAVVPLADWGGGEAAGTATGEAQEGRGACGTVPRE